MFACRACLIGFYKTHSMGSACSSSITQQHLKPQRDWNHTLLHSLWKTPLCTQAVVQGRGSQALSINASLWLITWRMTGDNMTHSAVISWVWRFPSAHCWAFWSVASMTQEVMFPPSLVVSHDWGSFYPTFSIRWWLCFSIGLIIRNYMLLSMWTKYFICLYNTHFTKQFSSINIYCKALAWFKYGPCVALRGQPWVLVWPSPPSWLS